jgi:hypothetical protein
MNRMKKLTILIPALIGSTVGIGNLWVTSAAFADTPPAGSEPPADGQNGRHHNPAWVACKKQADDQKIEPGDARKQFMRNCMGSEKSAPPAAS